MGKFSNFSIECEDTFDRIAENNRLMKQTIISYIEWRLSKEREKHGAAAKGSNEASSSEASTNDGDTNGV